MQEFSIGQLSGLAGVKVPTIRYYEQVGLIPPAARTAGNQRRYRKPALERLRFIAHARAMGFPMDSLVAMLRIAGHREAPCADIDDLVRERLDDVEARIAKLTRLRGELSAMLDNCRHGTVADCRILEVLADHEECGTEH